MSRFQTPVSRRAFFAGSVTAGLAAGSATTLARTSKPPGETSSEGYFDIHVHLTQSWYGRERGPLDADAMLRWMDSHGIAQAAVLPLVSPEAFWYPISTEFVLSETRSHRDRLIPFCSIDPRTLATHLTTRKQVVDMLGRYIDAGAKGFGEHKPRLPVNDPLNMRLYEACAEAKLPVLLHLDNQANMDKPGLPGLAEALSSFPDLAMIGHGKGWWASISGELKQSDLHVGYPQGPVAPGGAIDTLMDKHPNLYGDLSSSGAHAVSRDPEFGENFLLRRANRLLFGTDYYDLSQGEFKHFELSRQFEISNEARAQISRENARRLLRLA